MPTTARHVAQLSQLREDRAQRVVVDDEKILLVRDGDTVRAYSADCPHAGGPLEQGALCRGRIVCPWHKARSTRPPARCWSRRRSCRSNVTR